MSRRYDCSDPDQRTAGLREATGAVRRGELVVLPTDTVYGIGALMSAFSPGLGVLILGNSIFEGVGTALLIPPVYILTTMLFGDLRSRARAFGVISGMGGVGAAAGPLIGTGL